MEFISAEEFLKQPREVQRIFLDWWVPSIGDLFRWNSLIHDDDAHLVNCCASENMVERTTHFKGNKEGERIPLLTEGQLRKFIEDKTNRKIDLSYYQDTGYDICLDNFNGLSKNRHEFYLDLGNNLLQAYWKVALEICKGEIEL